MIHKGYTQLFIDQGSNIEGFNPFAIHFVRMSIYNEERKLYEIVTFNAMLVLERQFRDKGHADGFFYQFGRLMKYTRLSRRYLSNGLDLLKQKGIITTRTGKKGLNIYQVNYSAVRDNIGFFFKEEGIVGEDDDVPIHDFVSAYLDYHISETYKRRSFKTFVDDGAAGRIK